MEFALTNRAEVGIKGEIKAVWHRTFTGEFDNVSDDDGNTWADEIGRISIDIPSTTAEYKSKIPCVISTSRKSSKYCPHVSFYYRASGSDTWQLMRSDSDSELQRWKDADLDKIVGGSSDYPDKWWGILGGFNYQYISLED